MANFTKKELIDKINEIQEALSEVVDYRQERYYSETLEQLIKLLEQGGK